MKKIALSLITAASAVFSNLSAEELTVSTSVDYVTEYIFRGVELGDAAIQPGVELGYGDATFGIWASTTTNHDDPGQDEVDFYGSYNFVLSDMVNVDLGWTMYYYPNIANKIDGKDYTNEPFATFSFDTFLAPTLMAAYDIDLETFTLEGGIGYSWDLPYDNTTLDLGAYIGSVEVDSGSDFIYYGIDSSVTYQVTDNGALGVGLSYSSNDLDGAADNNLSGSVSVATSF